MLVHCIVLLMVWHNNWSVRLKICRGQASDPHFALEAQWMTLEFPVNTTDAHLSEM